MLLISLLHHYHYHYNYIISYHASLWLCHISHLQELSSDLLVNISIVSSLQNIVNKMMLWQSNVDHTLPTGADPVNVKVLYLILGTEETLLWSTLSPERGRTEPLQTGRRYGLRAILTRWWPLKQKMEMTSWEQNLCHFIKASLRPRQQHSLEQKRRH